MPANDYYNQPRPPTFIGDPEHDMAQMRRTDPPATREDRVIGFVLAAIAIIVLLAFAFGAGAKSDSKPVLYDGRGERVQPGLVQAGL